MTATNYTVNWIDTIHYSSTIAQHKYKYNIVTFSYKYNITIVVVAHFPFSTASLVELDCHGELMLALGQHC